MEKPLGRGTGTKGVTKLPGACWLAKFGGAITSTGLTPAINLSALFFQIENGGPEISIWDESRGSPFRRILAASNRLGYNIKFLLSTGAYVIEIWQILLVSPFPGNVVGDQV